MNKKIPTFYALCFILFAIFCIIMVSVFFRLNPTKSVMTENKTEPIIVIDAGHGGEDGGAVSESGVLEKDINLSIANNSADLLKIFGYKVVQTRTDDVSLDNGEDSVHSRKVADLKKRLEIFNSDKNNVVISIHQNKFSQSKYYGTQIFYSPNNSQSQNLAECIRNSVKKCLQPNNERQCKKADGSIYLLKKAENPSVIVECGFLSNQTECQKLAEEDPTFKTYTDEESGQTIIAGMGELHLEIIVDRLLREFKVEANVGKPQVSYKETITREATVDTRYARQTGGKGQFAHCKITVEPNESGKGYEFINKITGGAIPKEYIPCVDQGIQGAMQSGVLAGYQVVDVKVTLIDGSYHEVDSSEMAFKICGSMAFKEACEKAGPTLLEPIMKVVVTAPDEYMGDVMGDINARRGQIVGSDIRNGAAVIEAHVPLASMFGYATDLRSKTQGRATYSMEPSHYVELPKNLQETLRGTRKG